MQTEELVISRPEQIGEMVLSSQLSMEGEQQSFAVEVTTKGISFKDQFIEFTFDLRFAISEHYLTLMRHESNLTYLLPKHDDQFWRSTLRKYINQQGFHQQFKPMKKIGKGNFASVYLVQRFSDGHKFAVKAFSKQSAFSEQSGKECLVKEIEIMRSLNSIHNLTLCEVFESDNSLYIIFELIEGGQLYEKIKAKQKFKPRQIQNAMRTLLGGLQQMHQKGIMHRDLKPENILIRNTQTCECVIADFGLSEFCQTEDYLFVRCGTPGYVAPEVINIKDMKTKYKPICDMFSLGLVFHLLLFGKSIFKGKTYSQVLNENRNCSFKLEGGEYEMIDVDALDLLKKMLEVDPSNRISAKQALKHAYITSEVEDKMQEEMLAEQMDKVEIGESPILTTANQMRKMQKDLKRDSCLSFKMGKDNLITGKTQTMGTMQSGKLSGFGANLLKNFKASKFSKGEQKAS